MTVVEALVKVSEQLGRDMYFICLAFEDDVVTWTEVRADSEEKARAKFQETKPGIELKNIQGPFFKLPREWYQDGCEQASQAD